MDPMSTQNSPSRTWWPVARQRGALALVVGRGERASVYERFGRRLSADGYVVSVFEGDADTAALWLANAEAHPRVLIGSDIGASSVLRVLAQGAAVDGAIVAGTLVDIEGVLPSDEQRTACPLHRGVLESASSQRDETRTVESIPDRADLAAIEVPVLAFHGGADPVSPLETAASVLNAIPDLDFRETVGGLHDALNDASHRSVAASIVLWLERLRTGDARSPIVHRVALSSVSGAVQV